MKKATLFDTLVVVKRSGQRTTFQGEKIAIAIKKAFDSVEYPYQEEDVNRIYEAVLSVIQKEYKERKTIQIEDIQDLIEETLEKKGYQDVYHSFQNYREQRSASRKAFVTKQQHKFLKTIEALGLKDKDEKSKRERSPYERLNNYGITIASGFTKAYLLENKILKAIDTGLIEIPHLEAISLGSIENIELDIERLLKEGVALHTKEEEIHNIEEFLDFLLLLLNSVATTIYGQILIPNLDYDIAPYILSTYKECLQEEIQSFLEYSDFKTFLSIERIQKEIEHLNSIDEDFPMIKTLYPKAEFLQLGFEKAGKQARKKMEKRIQKAISHFLTNLNSIYDKTSSYPTISIGFGTNIEKEGLLFTKTILKCEKECSREVPFYLWKLQKGKNQKSEDPYYSYTELYLNLAIHSSKFRFINLEMKANKALYQNGNKTTEVCYFQDGGRAVDDTTTQDARIIGGKGNLFTCSMNLPRLTLKLQQEKHTVSENDFFKALDQSLDLAKDALLSCFEILCSKKSFQFPLLFGENIWQDGKNLKETDRLRKILKHGTLSIHFVGLEETLFALTNEKRIEERSKKLATKILHHMREKVNSYSTLYNLNFTLTGKKVEDVCRHFNQIDTAIYGKSKGITEKEAYTNSFESSLSSWKSKLLLEKDYHSFTNGGHLSCFFLSENEKKHAKDILETIEKEELGAFYFKQKD